MGASSPALSGTHCASLVFISIRLIDRASHGPFIYLSSLLSLLLCGAQISGNVQVVAVRFSISLHGDFPGITVRLLSVLVGFYDVLDVAFRTRVFCLFPFSKCSLALINGHHLPLALFQFQDATGITVEKNRLAGTDDGIDCGYPLKVWF